MVRCQPISRPYTLDMTIANLCLQGVLTESTARTGQVMGETNLFLYPGAELLRTVALLINFDLPSRHFSYSDRILIL
jgi:hypothetical protein